MKIEPPAGLGNMTWRRMTVKAKRAILIILDGLGDVPVPSLGDRTPLQAARTPVLDRLAREGSCGIMDIIAPGTPVESDVAHLTLFGYGNPDEYPGRGVLEAMGAGLKLKPGDVAFRGNFALLEGNKVLNRHPGRNPIGADEIIEFINSINSTSNEGFRCVEIIAAHSTEQRFSVVFRGDSLSPAVSATDPGMVGKLVQDCEPLDGSIEAKRTASLVNELSRYLSSHLGSLPMNERRASAGLPIINGVLLRGAGTPDNLKPLNEKYGLKAACIAGNGLIRGMCEYLGFHVVKPDGATGTATTNIDAKLKAVLALLPDYDFVFMHVKGTDNLAHDKKPEQKRDFIERFDVALSQFISELAGQDVTLFITGDHATPSMIGRHSGDPVPLLAFGPTVIPDPVEHFDEQSCAKGYFSRIKGKYFFNIILNKLYKLKKYGA